MENIREKSVSDFLNNEVKEFARYVVETRACPRLSDGLRTGARKAVYAAMTFDMSKKSKVKILTLTGEILKLQYHHGDISLHNTITQLASDYLFKYKPIDIIGQIGFIRQTSCDVAPRYLSAKQSPHINLFKYDSELWDIQVDDGESIEPKTLYPIIPMSLLYRTSSPGFGFSYKCFSYTIDSVIDNCIKSLLTGSCSDAKIPLIPEVVGVKSCNMIYNHQKNYWYSIGEYECDYKSDILTITDLPYNIQFEQYEKHLSDLEDKLIIKSYQNLSNVDNLKYIIKFNYGGLERLAKTGNKFFQTFKLYSKIPYDILNMIDDKNNIVSYKNAYHVIDAFVKYRSSIYENRRSQLISILKNKISKMSELIKFIKLIVDGELIINNRSIADVKIDLKKYKLSENLLKINIEKLTKDEIDILTSQIKDTENYLNYILNTPSTEIYLNELIELKSTYSKIIEK